MFLINKFNTKNVFNYFLFTTYLLTIIYIKETSFIFYNSTDSPDFIRYFKFLEFNVNHVENTSSEQGFLFYDLHSLYFYFRDFNLTEQNFFIYLSKSIQELNSVLFLIGSLGLYKLLKIFNYTNTQILSALIFINLAPIAVAQRIVFKPEIMIFALLPWLIFSYELFCKSKKIIYLFCSIPILIALILQKGSSLAMISIFLTIFYLKPVLSRLKNYKKTTIGIVLIIFLMPLYLTYSENSRLNTQNLLDLQSGAVSEAKYDNKGSLDLLYLSKVEELFYYPYKNEHNYSAINITLLDSFGDYFEIYWKNDSSFFSKDQSNVFLFEKSDNTKAPLLDFENNQITIFTQENENNYYIRNLFSLGLSLFFYTNFLYLYKKVQRPKKKFFILPILGYLILIFHIISGFPENNFDPLIGDTLKPFYYSFFLIIAIGFTITEIAKTKLRSIILLTLIFPIFMYIYGFPKNFSNESRDVLNQVNSYSTFCVMNNNIFNFVNSSEIKCENKPLGVKNYNKYESYNAFNLMPNLHIVNFSIFFLIIFSLVYLSFVKMRI
tara:strand:- start:2578 stop:4227 length:1650 start_codon:yes stop_codon:yes gene_type:complete